MANTNNILIRLTTDDPTGLFDAEIHEDIFLNPNSQIALQNLVINDNSDALVIDSSNDSFIFKLGASNPQGDVKLEHETYTRTNAPDLFDDITMKVNKEISYTGSSKSVGMECLCSLIKDKVSFSFKNNGRFITDNKSTYIKTNNVTVAAANNTKITVIDSTVPDGFNSYVAYTKPFVKGAGLSSLYIETINAPMNIILAFLDKNPEDNTTPYVQNDLYYGIRATFAEYSYIINGVETPTGIVPKNKDNIAIELKGSEIYFNVYNEANANVIELGKTPNTYGLYYPAVFRYTSNDASTTISNFATFLSPFDLSANNIINNEDIAVSVGVKPPSPSGTVTNDNELVFGSISLANFLGFVNLKIGPIKAGYNINFNAPNFFDTTFIPECIIVELLNIDVKSYDSLTNKRKNILAVIPNPLTLNDRIIFDSQYPLYLSLRNTNSFSLRNIKARILNTDLSPIEINGRASMTLLIK